MLIILAMLLVLVCEAIHLMNLAAKQIHTHSLTHTYTYTKKSHTHTHTLSLSLSHTHTDAHILRSAARVHGDAGYEPGRQANPKHYGQNCGRGHFSVPPVSQPVTLTPNSQTLNPEP